ncbi:MAG: outer membrane beta-barrel protein, partial [Thiothrix sp.]
MKLSKTTRVLGFWLLASHTTVWAGTPSAGMSAKPFTPLAPSGSSSAQAPNYLGASIGKTSADSVCDPLTWCGNTATSWKTFAGVRVNENIVLEGSYVDFGKQTGLGKAGTPDAQQASAFTLGAVAGIPVSTQIEAFGKAGLARWTHKHQQNDSSTATTGTDVFVGAGAN